MVAAFLRAYFGAVLNRGGIVIAVMAAILAGFAWWSRDFRLDASADSLVLESDSELQRFREMGERYSSREFLFVTFTPQGGDLFSDESLSAIVRLRDDLAAVPGVESVFSIVDVPLIKQKEGTLLQLSKNYRLLLDADVDRARARRELVESPLFSELVISLDGTTTALQVNLRAHPDYERLVRQRNRLLVAKHRDGLSPEQEAELEAVNAEYVVAKERVMRENHETIEAVREVIAAHRGAAQLHLGGIPMIADDMITYVRNDLIVFGGGVFLFIVAVLSVLFRGLRWVLLPLLNCGFSVVVMIGLLGLMGWPVTVISSNFVALMLIMTISMNVHLAVRYRQLRRDFRDWDQKTLVRETVRRMWAPCLYTALTTMMGFGSLVISDIKPVIDFGWMMTAGLAVTVATSFVLFPTLLARLGRREADTREKEEVPLTAALAGFTERHRRIVLVASLLLAVGSVAGMTRLQVENSFINYFRDETEIYQGLKLIDEKLGGTTPLDVILKFETAAPAPEDPEQEEFEALFGETDKADYWFTPEKVDLIKGVHDYLESLPAVGKVLSLASTVRLAESLTRGQEFNTFELAVLYKRLPEELRNSMISPYVSLERDEARITMRIRDSLPDLRRDELLRQISADLQEKFGLKAQEFQVTGLLVLYNNMLQSLFRSQILTLGAVILGIALMLVVLFRSVSLAVIGIIPNIMASLMILGLMGWMNVPLDMMTITIASITIGIAVDNAIHYIYRFREELPRHGWDYVRTMHYCHANIGRAVFYTAIIIVVGFSILVLSNFIPTIYFGLLTALAMVAALLGALTLLPLMLLIWRPIPVPADASLGVKSAV